MAERTRKPARVKAREDKSGDQRRPAPPAPTPNGKDAESLAALPSPAEAVTGLIDPNLILRAIVKCRPGTARGQRNKAWDRLGTIGVYEAARLHLAEHLPAKAIRKRLNLPITLGRPLDRLLSNIRAAHTALLDADLDRRAAIESLLPSGGNTADRVERMVNTLLERMAPVVNTFDWHGTDYHGRNNMLRMYEMLAGASKDLADARHTDAKAERLVGMLRSITQSAERRGAKTVDVADLVGVIDEVFGLRQTTKPAAPAVPTAPTAPTTGPTTGPTPIGGGA